MTLVQTLIRYSQVQDQKNYTKKYSFDHYSKELRFIPEMVAGILLIHETKRIYLVHKLNVTQRTKKRALLGISLRSSS